MYHLHMVVVTYVCHKPSDYCASSVVHLGPDRLLSLVTKIQTVFRYTICTGLYFTSVKHNVI